MGGAKVGGANVGGAKVGGAKVGGAKVGVLLLCDIFSQHVIRSHMHDVYTELYQLKMIRGLLWNMEYIP